MNFKEQLACFISQKTSLASKDEILNIIEPPPSSEMGDYALPCFKFASVMKKSPALIANQLKEMLSDKPDFIDQIIANGPYLNFFAERSLYAESVLREVINLGENYGKSEFGVGKTIIIDYSSPNIAKNFHVGHLRSTVIGNALYNIYNSLGYRSIGINHLGDWGTQFGKLMVAYYKWSSEELINENGLDELTRIYVKFHDEAKKYPALDDDARTWLIKLQNNEPKAIELWKWFCELSMKQFNEIYDRLGIGFDYFTGESFYNDKMDAVVDELREKGLLTESDGAMIVDLEQYKMPPCLILRRDGGTLYPTRDIAAALYRKENFHFDKCLYVTAIDQSLHFAQWFKVIGLMGYEWDKDLIHVPFGLVSLESGALSTRSGNVILMRDILNESVRLSRKIIEDKNPELDNKDFIAEKVGIGAVIFNDLYNSRIKDVEFSWERAVNFDGETGPYVQYTFARASSVLNKGSKIYDMSFENVDFTSLSDPISFEVLKLVSVFPDKITEAGDRYEPYIISRYLIDLAQSFNSFYNKNKILKAEENVRIARLMLVFCTSLILKSGMKLLGIYPTDKM